VKNIQLWTRLDLWEIAKQMMQRGARPPLVRESTRLPIAALRDLWHEIYGVRPPSGLSRDNCLSLLRRKRHVLHANMFMREYHKIAGDDIFRHADDRSIIKAYDTFLSKITAMEMRPCIDFPTCWYIARDLRSRVLTIKYCRQCDVEHMYSPQSEETHLCPYCDILDQTETMRGTYVPISAALS